MTRTISILMIASLLLSLAAASALAKDGRVNPQITNNNGMTNSNRVQVPNVVKDPGMTMTMETDLVDIYPEILDANTLYIHMKGNLENVGAPFKTEIVAWNDGEAPVTLYRWFYSLVTPETEFISLASRQAQIQSYDHAYVAVDTLNEVSEVNETNNRIDIR